MYARWFVVLVLCGCLPGSKTAGDRIAEAEAALAARNYAAVDEALAHARGTGHGDNWRADAWVSAKSAEVSARMRRMQIEDALAAAKSLNDVDALQRLLPEVIIMRAVGADDALEQKVRTMIDTRATNFLTAFRAATGTPAYFDRAADAMTVLSHPTLQAPVRAEILALVRTAAELHDHRARLTLEYPLAQRVHLGQMARFVGDPAPDASATLKRFVPGVHVKVNGPASCAKAAPPFAAIGTPKTERQVELLVQLDECPRNYTSKKLDGTYSWTTTETIMKTVSREVRECGKRQVQSVTTSCVSSDSHAGRWSMCSSGPSGEYITVEVCENVWRTFEEPESHDRLHVEARPGTLDEVTVGLRGSYVMTFNGQERKGRLEGSGSDSRQVMPAYKEMAAQTAKPDENTAWSKAVTARFPQMQKDIDDLFAADLAAQIATAQAAEAANDQNAAEDAWARAALMGSKDTGIWARSYGLTYDEFIISFATSFPAVPTPEPLVARKSFPVPEKVDTNSVTLSESKDIDDTRPTSLARSGWFTITPEYLRVPTLASTDVASGELAGDQSALITMQLSGGLMFRKKTWGMVLVDEVGVRLGVGARFAGAEQEDASFGGLATLASGSYALAGGIRARGIGGVFVGLRPEAGAMLLGTTTGVYTTVPAFARLELPFVKGLLAAEASGFSIAGREHWGAMLHFNQRTAGGNKIGTLFIRVRAERQSLDAGIRVYDTTTQDSTRRDADLDLTTFSLDLGAGF